MTVGYHSRHGQLCPEYVCQREGISRGEPACQRIPGAGIDQVIGALLVEAVNPVALEVTLVVQRELQSRFEEADRSFFERVEHGFRTLANADPARIKWIDATQPIAAVAAEVWKQVESLIAKNALEK